MHDEGMHVGIEIVLARAYYPRALHTRVCEHVQSRTLAEIISIAFSFRNQTIRGFCAITWRNWFKIGCPRMQEGRITLQFRWNVAGRTKRGTDGNIITWRTTLVSPLPIGLSISAHVVSNDEILSMLFVGFWNCWNF